MTIMENNNKYPYKDLSVLRYNLKLSSISLQMRTK